MLQEYLRGINIDIARVFSSLYFYDLTSCTCNNVRNKYYEKMCSTLSVG